jgi:hypothetical protein
MKNLRRLAAVGLLVAISPVQAGVYTDDLSRCLVDKSSTADKSVLVQWIFVAMAQHPSVVSLTKISSDDKEKHNGQAGELFMRLLTDTCADESKKALKNEGALAIQTAFQVLGQAAAREIFSDPSVAEMMSGLDKYVDKEKLETLVK